MRAWLIALVLTAATSALAVPAPGLSWRTLRTPCCDVHFHEAVRPQGERVAAMADHSLALVSALLKSRPTDRVQIVVSDATDRLNGFATSLPYNLVQVFAVPPERDADLATSEDHLRMVLIHELFHIVHLDTVHGLPKLVNTILGKTWPPNFILPRWVHEGMAVYAETRFTGGGRLRSARWRGYLRQAALRDDLWSLDDVSNFSRRPPGGGAAYLYGAAFVQFLTETRGEDWLARFNHDYANRIIPYGVGRSIEAASGVSLDDAWRDFHDHLRAVAAAKVKEIEARGGVTQPRRLTRLGGVVDRPRLKDGRLYLVANPPNGAVGIYAVDGLPAAPSRPRAIARLNNDAELDVIEAGRFVVSQTEWTGDWFPWRDLFVITDDAVRRLTHGERLQGPVVDKSGERVFAVRITGVSSALVSVELDSGLIREIATMRPGEVAYSPAVSPDGRSVVVSLRRKNGPRDLVLFDVPTGARRDLTRDAAMNVDPTFTPDGQSLVFASDRDGVLNLYTLDLTDGARHRLTDLTGGASAPIVTPDGKAVIYVDTHLDGADVYAVPFAPRSIAGEQVVRWDLEYPELDVEEERVELEESLYDPLRTLWPRSWVPVLAADNFGGVRAGLALVGSDAVETQSWALEASYGLTDQRPRVGFRWRFADLYVPLGFGASWRTTISDARRTSDGLPVLHTEQLFRLSGDVTLPLRRFLRSHQFRLSYSRDFRVVETEVKSGADGVEPTFPTQFNIGAAGLTWSYRETQSNRDSAATDFGLTTSTTLRIGNQFTLSDTDIMELSTNLSFFRPVPGLVGHSAGVYLSGAYSVGPRGARSSHFLGGLGDRNIVGDLVDGFRFGGRQLRGFAPNSDAGDGFAFGSLEYRLPLISIERGFGTIPLQLSRANVALFTDVGDAFDGMPRFDQMRVGVGAELRVTMTVGYYALFLVRAGFARGLTRGGVEQPYIVLGVPY